MAKKSNGNGNQSLVDYATENARMWRGHCLTCRTVPYPIRRELRDSMAVGVPVRTAARWLEQVHGINVSYSSLYEHIRRQGCIDYDSAPDA